MSRDYSLGALRKLREAEKSTAEEAVGIALRALNDANDALKECEQRADAHDQQTRATEAREAVFPVSGTMLQQRADWLRRRRNEREDLRIGADEARRLVRHRERELAVRREALIEAEALLLAVEKHHASWARAQMAKAEDAMDDEAADRAASRSSSNLP